MDDLTFYKGWSILTAQPYAQFLAYDETKFRIQESLFKNAIAKFDGPLWLKVIEHWVTTQTEWPKLPEILSQLKSKLPPKPLQLCAPPAPTDYLPRRLYYYSKEYDCSIFDAALALIPEWLKTAERGDPDYARAQMFLKTAQDSKNSQHGQRYVLKGDR